MIDDKKIEEAARRNADKYRNYPTLSNEDRDKVSICSFMEGTKWMQEEFLKNLWHPVSEKPKRRCNYLLLHYKDEEEECFEADVVDTKAWDLYIKGSLVGYININDLFAKKGD